jgi:hypothetical protein
MQSTSRGRDPLHMTRIERLEVTIGTVIVERQALRERSASRHELESNRLRLVRLQRDLSQALIDQYRPR